MVNRSSIHIWLAGEEITASCLFESIASGYGYRVSYFGASMFPGINTQVRVSADNLCVPAQNVDYTYSFQTGSLPCSTEWTENLTINGVKISNGDTSTVQLYFGVANAASDGYDSLDGIAPPPPPDGMNRIFKINASRPEFESLLRDIRSSSDDTVIWKITNGGVDEAEVFAPTWATWDSSVINLMLPPSNCQLSIWGTDPGNPAGEPISPDNIHNSNSYTFTANQNLWIRYIPYIPTPHTITGIITVEDHLDYAGTAIHLENASGTLHYDVVTPSSGALNFLNLPSGNWYLTATRDSFVTWVDTIAIVDSSQVVNHEMMWPRYSFCGTVTAIGADTPGGALVTVDGSLSAMTDASDSFHVNVPFNGQMHTVVVSMPRFSTDYDTVVVNAGALCDHSYTLNRVCFGLTGHVTSGGTPVAGVSIRVTPGNLPATTDASGLYRLDSCLVDGDYTVAATLTCYNDASTGVTITGGAATADLTLTHSFVDMTGYITLQGETDYSGTSVTVNPGGLTAMTDASGMFVINGLTCGSDYSISATHSNFADLNGNFTAAVGYTYRDSLLACRNITGFTVSDSTMHVVLNWAAQTGATGYEIFRDGVSLGTFTGTTYTDAAVTFGTSYSYNMVVHYLTCESAQLTTPRAVMVVPAIPTQRYLLLDFDNGLTVGGGGISDSVAAWITEISGPGALYVTEQNQNLGAFGQPWLNHFDLVYIITGVNGPSTDYFDATTAGMLHAYAAVSGKHIVWEGASAATDITAGTLPAALRTFFNDFHVTRVSAGHPSATGNVQTMRFPSGRTGFFHTAAVFNYAYLTTADNMNDVLGTGTGATSIITSAPGTDLVRGVEYHTGTNALAFTSVYSAAASQPASMFHNGRRIVGQYFCNWFGSSECSNVPTLESPEARVNEPTLYQNTPNPFADMTTIRFAVPSAGQAELDVYTVTGEHVASLANDYLNAGTYSVNWYSSGLSNGVYLYRLTTEAGSAVRSMTVAK
jgi:hypothetical protein